MATAAPAGTPRPARARPVAPRGRGGPARRRRGPGWVPNQHGAWAMLLLPALVGALAAGPRWWHLLLVAAWFAGYLAFFATGLWLRARLKARYLPPVRAYAVLTLVLGGATVLLEPAVLRWAVVYAPLLAVSLWFSWRRADRAVVNDLLTVVAAGLMAVVAHAPGARLGAWPTAGWLPGGDEPRAWFLAAVLVAYFAGTVLYVKTMIRERGNPRMYRASVGYHVAVAALALLPVLGWPTLPLDRGVAVALVVLLVLLAVRAAVVPRRWPTATPKAVGIGEIGVSVALGVVLLLL